MKKNIKKLLEELVSENQRVGGFLNSIKNKLDDIDKRYGQAIVKDDINFLKNYKKILAREAANN